MTILVCHNLHADGYLASTLWPEAVVTSSKALEDVVVPPSEWHAARRVVFHIDRTFARYVPSRRVELVHQTGRQGIAVWNGFAVDISKRAVQEAVKSLRLPNLSVPFNAPDGDIVIVKSNENCGGLPENRVSGIAPSAVHQIGATKNYIVAPLGEIPHELRADPNVVVERYISNAEGVYFRVYRSGRRVVVSASRGPELIKQMGFGRPRESWFFELPDLVPCHESDKPVREIAHQAALVMSRLGLCFGAVDLVMDDQDAVYVCDVNSTPFWEESEQEIEDFLRDHNMSE